MLKDNTQKLKTRISVACSRVNRDPSSVTIVAVSKNRTAGEIREALDAGIADIGENRLQEALLKHQQLTTNNYQLTTIRWHMVGHLQTNKVKEAVMIFDLIHSVDSLRLALEIDRQAAKVGKVQDVLIEVKTSPEATKFGLAPQEAAGVIAKLTPLENIKISGLMTIAPLADDPEKARPYFRALRELRDKINRLNTRQLTVLSMGMTDDFTVAVEEGATMVRLGRAIFDSTWC